MDRLAVYGPITAWLRESTRIERCQELWMRGFWPRASLGLCAVLLLAVSALGPAAVHAQESMRSAIATFAFDLHEGMQRSSLTQQQKEQVRNDLKTLRQAHQNGDRRAAFKALINFDHLLDSGAFQPQDEQRIRQDLKNLRQAKKESGGGGGMGMGGMR
jgi:Spy/CpxP family protein refolding chaperone